MSDNIFGTKSRALEQSAINEEDSRVYPDVLGLSQSDLQNLPMRQLHFDGFRLDRIDLYNWGSFNNNVKSVYFGGQNVLMTGDNGAGKSSIIDAITVLLYDVQKIVFNQAAGAEKNERNLASYVWGLYKNDNSTGVKTELGLRSNQKAVLTVIMASFYNQKLNERVVLVQCLTINKQKTNPDRAFFISDQDFNLAKDVLPVADLKELSSKLRALGCQRMVNFKEYSGQLQRRFGIEGTKVLDLFYKTISMKSISNISDFVRKQMLEDFNGDALVDEIIDRFDDLDAAYKSVEEAKQQVEALRPIRNKGIQFDEIKGKQIFLNSCYENVTPYLNIKKSALIDQEIQGKLAQDHDLNEEIAKYRQRLEEINSNILSVRSDLDKNGGQRIESLKKDIISAQKERERLYKTYSTYANFVHNVGLEAQPNEANFKKVLGRLDKLANEQIEQRNSLENQIDSFKAQLNEDEKKRQSLEKELMSLRSRRNNLPSIQIEVRNRICKAINCPENKLPYVGELLQIKNEEKAVWEDAIEKVLRNYALSLLVPEEYYADVVNYVNNNNLGTRLVFFRVKEGEDEVSYNAGRNLSTFGNRPTITSHSLVRKLDIKSDPTFYPYLKGQLERNYNYYCTQSEDEYRSERSALMPSGLTKKGGRNEKDDRSRGRQKDYVLGWTNEDKILSLAKELSQCQTLLQTIRNNVRQAENRRLLINNNLISVNRIKEYNSFTALDYVSQDLHLEKLQEELDNLNHTSDMVSNLAHRLEEYEQDKVNVEKRLANAQVELGKAQERLKFLRQQFELAKSLSEAASYLEPEVQNEIEQRMQKALEILHYEHINYEQVDKLIIEIEGRLKNELSDLRRQNNELTQELVNLQSNFNRTFIVAGKNLDSSRADAWVDFNNLLERLEADDLPRFVDDFKHKLSNDTLEQFATLNAYFNSSRRSILSRIDEINEIMKVVDFNENRYIRMVANESKDSEIQKFRADLKACTTSLSDSANPPLLAKKAEEATLAEGEVSQTDVGRDDRIKYVPDGFDLSEANRKFHEVKALIDRFKGEVNGIDIDGRWRRKVTNVKEWFDFSASEHSREDDRQVDYYEDSGGKSGGQKEKLAYTVLASSLAYQFKSKQRAGMANNDRSYRFVIIDEAFGRGSPQSVDYALTLFGKFNLQLLVATPMQKLDIIEKYVNHVAFVYRNEQTNESTIFNYELEDYILKRNLKEIASKAVFTEQDIEKSRLAQEQLKKLDSQIKDNQEHYGAPSVLAIKEAQSKIQGKQADTKVGSILDLVNKTIYAENKAKELTDKLDLDQNDHNRFVAERELTEGKDSFVGLDNYSANKSQDRKEKHMHNTAQALDRLEHLKPISNQEGGVDKEDIAMFAIVTEDDDQ